MTRQICVYGLWHLGCVTAACLAEAGFSVVGLDPDGARIEALRVGQAPIAEPGLDDLIATEIRSGRLRFTTDVPDALTSADVLWVAFDTPVDEADQADSAWVRSQLDRVLPTLRPATLVVISSQVPVGFCAAVQADWSALESTVSIACVPENLRLGQALAVFRAPDRLVAGIASAQDQTRLAELLEPFSRRIEWMSLESAEMTKHALNAFLAVSIAYTNELARICERVGADARDVERGLRSDPRIGPQAYVSPGPPFAGGTLARDVILLGRIAAEQGVQAPVLDAVPLSNRTHGLWTREHLTTLLADTAEPRAALLGLTYKPGTDTLRRSESLELGHWLTSQNVQVRAYDPAVRRHSVELGAIELADGVSDALSGADVAIVATAWPEFRDISVELVLASMRRPAILDVSSFLGHLAASDQLIYVRVGQPLRDTAIAR